MSDVERDEWTIYCAWSLDGEEFPASVDPEPAPGGEPFKVVRADAYQGAVDLLREIAESDPVDNALDPGRNRRIARSFFATSTAAGATE